MIGCLRPYVRKQPIIVLYLLKIKRNDWLLADMFTQNKAQWLAACGHMSTSSQSLGFILGFYFSFRVIIVRYGCTVPRFQVWLLHLITEVCCPVVAMMVLHLYSGPLKKNNKLPRLQLQGLMLICSWTHRGSTWDFLKLWLSVGREPFSLYHHSVLIWLECFSRMIHCIC